MTAEKYYFEVKNDILNPFSHGVFSVSGLIAVGHVRHL